MVDFGKVLADERQVYMVFDYETFSEADLSAVGAWEYAAHPSTEILCVGFRIGTRRELEAAVLPTFVGVPGDATYRHFLRTLFNPDVMLVAHNALFEIAITTHCILKKQKVDLSRWICTAALARSMGLPGKLEGAAQAFRLPYQKDMAGHRLMLKLSRPRTPSKNDPSTRHNRPEDLQRLYDYCAADIAAETGLFLGLPPLTERERAFWLLDMAINLDGFAVDRQFVSGALTLIERETERLDRQAVRLTRGLLNSTRQRDATLMAVRALGVAIADLRAETIKDALAGDLPIEARALLEARAAASRSSTSKYAAFEARSRTDGRARDNTLFYGAHTGRQAGTGLQPQNLFKSVLAPVDLEVGIDRIREVDGDTIDAFFDKPMDLFASAVRGAIVAPPGKILDVGDFKTIEVRVLFWLAGHAAGLEALRSGVDLYIEMAARVYGVRTKELQRLYDAKEPQAQQRRQLGKQTVLGAGFGIGKNGVKFQQTAKQYGMIIPLSLAQKAIAVYRQVHHPIPRFWSALELAATRAMLNPGKAFQIGELTWCLTRHGLQVKLPIGRKLTYRDAALERKANLYGSDSPVITYFGVDSKTRKWVKHTTWGGKLTENVVQAVARDVMYEALVGVAGDTRSRPVLAVHDEIVSERETSSLDSATDEAWWHRRFKQAMEKVPDWAKGLPIEVETWSGTRYRK